MLIRIAEFSDNLKLAQLLIDNGAKVNQADKNLWTPLYTAAFYGENQFTSIIVIFSNTF